MERRWRGVTVWGGLEMCVGGTNDRFICMHQQQRRRRRRVYSWARIILQHHIGTGTTETPTVARWDTDNCCFTFRQFAQRNPSCKYTAAQTWLYNRSELSSSYSDLAPCLKVKPQYSFNTFFMRLIQIYMWLNKAKHGCCYSNSSIIYQHLTYTYLSKISLK